MFARIARTFRTRRVAAPVAPANFGISWDAADVSARRAGVRIDTRLGA